MTELLHMDGLDQVRPSFSDSFGSSGAAEYFIGRVLLFAHSEFREIRSAKYEQYGGQSFEFDVGEDPSIIDMTILPEDLEEVIQEIQFEYRVELGPIDVEVIEAYLNSYINPRGYPDDSRQSRLPFRPAGQQQSSYAV